MCYYTSQMACPYFHPSAPLAGQAASDTAIFPLGECWAGECRAAAADGFLPPRETLRAGCNFGYARATCSRFPAGDGADAVRFTISRDDGGAIGVYYVLERDHHPFAHGPLEYSPATRAFTAAPAASGELLPQASAYVQSYLRRRHDGR